MRLKGLIALSLALVMLVTLATPALAGRPAKGVLTIYPPETADTNNYSLQATHDNDIKVKVVLRGASPSTQYQVLLFWGMGTGDPGNSVVLDNATTDERGNLRYVTKYAGWSPGTTRNFQLKLLRSPYAYPANLAFVGQIETFTFK